MLKAFGNHPQRQGLDLGHRLASVSAVAEYAGQCWHFRQPAAVVLALELDRERHLTTLHPGRLAQQAREADGADSLWHNPGC